MKKIFLFFYDFFYTLVSIFLAFRDLLMILFLPKGIISRADFAFLVHPRGAWDTWKPFPFLKYFGEKVTYYFSYLMPPIVLSQITLRNSNLKGLLIATVNEPEHMRRHPKFCAFLAYLAGILAEKNGARIIGLGAYLPYLTRYGEIYKKREVGYTTGHAMTAWMISEFINKFLEKEKCVAIVGAGGSTGQASAKILVSRFNFRKLILFDLPKKETFLIALRDDLKRINPGLEIELAFSLEEKLKEADLVVVVTTAKGTIIRKEFLKEGAVIIDDSQPRNTTPEILDKVQVFDVLACVPGLDVHFDFDLDLENPEVTFTCLAEVVALASKGLNISFSSGFVKVERVLEIGKIAKELGIVPAFGYTFGKKKNE